MLESLKKRWKVSSVRLLLILITFALSGTTTAWLSRSVIKWTQTPKGTGLWWALTTGVLLIGYQIVILLWGFILGQFSFFWNYEKKVLGRLGLLPKGTRKLSLAIFASGKGSNYQSIAQFFKNHPKVAVTLVVTNNRGAGVVQLAKEQGSEVLFIDNEEVRDGRGLLQELKKRKIDYLVLAGFLRKIPEPLLGAFPQKIINIHPALLPKFGGKGMYGEKVHKAVIESKEKESGITIHFVDEHYDNGDIIFQAKCNIDKNETASSLSKKIHALEQEHFAKEIEKLIQKQNPR